MAPRLADAGASATAAAARSRRSCAPLRGARVLLVEDNEINQQIAAELLRDAGIEVDVAENGQDGAGPGACAHADGRPFDVVLMDCRCR